jgi:hypothetical protein
MDISSFAGSGSKAGWYIHLGFDRSTLCKTIVCNCRAFSDTDMLLSRICPEENQIFLLVEANLIPAG